MCAMQSSVHQSINHLIFLHMKCRRSTPSNDTKTYFK